MGKTHGGLGVSNLRSRAVEWKTNAAEIWDPETDGERKGASSPHEWWITSEAGCLRRPPRGTQGRSERKDRWCWAAQPHRSPAGTPNESSCHLEWTRGDVSFRRGHAAMFVTKMEGFFFRNTKMEVPSLKWPNHGFLSVVCNLTKIFCFLSGVFKVQRV